MVIWGPSTNHPEHYARKVLEAAVYLHVTFEKDQWLWRGQSQHKSLRPGMHSPVLRLPKADQTEQKVRDATADLIAAARTARLDEFDGATLPDIALLSHLQHQGAATPLLDVTVDPLVALWMAANASVASPGAADDKTGYLFAIRQPAKHIAIMDARPHEKISAAIGGTDIYWYRSPDVSERLRIQRGSFVIGCLDTTNEAAQTIPLREGTNPDWLKNRMARMGRKNAVKSQSDVFAIRIRGACKSYLRRLLAERCGLDVRSIYPTPWHRPFVEDFAKSYGRLADIA
jgi:hypothetical protein